MTEALAGFSIPITPLRCQIRGTRRSPGNANRRPTADRPCARTIAARRADHPRQTPPYGHEAPALVGQRQVDAVAVFRGSPPGRCPPAGNRRGCSRGCRNGRSAPWPATGRGTRMAWVAAEGFLADRSAAPRSGAASPARLNRCGFPSRCTAGPGRWFGSPAPSAYCAWPCSSQVYQVTPTSASCAISSRRRPGVCRVAEVVARHPLRLDASAGGAGRPQLFGAGRLRGLQRGWQASRAWRSPPKGRRVAPIPDKQELVPG